VSVGTERGYMHPLRTSKSRAPEPNNPECTPAEQDTYAVNLLPFKPFTDNTKQRSPCIWLKSHRKLTGKTPVARCGKRADVRVEVRVEQSDGMVFMPNCHTL
jgi:hypothetical protein